MKTPNGLEVKMTKLCGPRWRLETAFNRIFVEKCGPSAARLEHLSGEVIGNYPVWGHAMNDALRLFDEWTGKLPPPETTGPETGLTTKTQYHVVWSGKTARECTTTIMEYVDQEHWDNFFVVTLYIVNWDLRRIVHTIDVPIDEKEGWQPDFALEKIRELVKDLERLLRMYAYEIEQGVMTWNNIQI